jgi:DTW domain-containing protein YfiP
MAAKRTICRVCDYPQVTCVCSAVESISAPVPLFLLQDKWEAKHAKNTGKLINACLSNAHIINVDSNLTNDINALQQLNELCHKEKNRVLLVFPNSEAQKIKSLSKTDITTITHLIFIDTTWRKATRLLALHPWISRLESIEIEGLAPSQYEIRKSKDNKGVSTIEAVDTCLNTLFGFKHLSLGRSFDALKSHWQRYQSK